MKFTPGRAPDHAEEPKIDRGDLAGPRIILILRTIALVLGVLHFVLSRYVIYSDGISYLEIARNYAGHHWHEAINTYWSPLYSWLLAAVFAVIQPERRNDTVVLHLLNLIAYLAAFAAFEGLLRRLSSLPGWGGLVQRKSFLISAYGGFMWAGLDAIGIWRCSPDMIVMLLVIVLGNLLFDIRVAPRPATFLVFGALLALGYLAKTAMLPVDAAFAALAIASAGTTRTRFLRAGQIGVVFLLLAVPFPLMMHAHTGTWTLGDSGRLNYGWEVCGASRWMHWQGEPGNIGTPLHPTRKLLDKPALYEFGSPILTSYAPWYNPVYWYGGIRPRFQFGRQLAVMGRNLIPIGWLILFAPGCLMGLAVGAVTRRWDLVRPVAFLLIPSLAALLVYWPVYVESRYLAGSYLVLTVLLVGVAIRSCGNAKLHRAIAITSGALVLYAVAPYTARVFVWSNATTNRQWVISQELQRYGLKPGDRVAYVGHGMEGYWATLMDVRIVCEVPTIYRRDHIDNSLMHDYSNVYAFWSAKPEVKQQAIALMRQSGVRAIFADVTPEWADTRGWTRVLATRYSDEYGRGRVYFKLIDRSE